MKRATFGHIRRGDAARRSGDWAAAGMHYRRALDLEPDLQHIWLQLGHALKETADPAGAETAYRRAAALAPHQAEPLVRLGHMLKAAGELRRAAASFIAGLQAEPDHLEATAELARLLPGRDDDEALWAEALAAFRIEPAEARAKARPALPIGAILVEATDLFAYFGRARLPTGIQRVQIELLLAMLGGGMAASVHVAVYAGVRRGWLLLPPELVIALCAASLVSDDRFEPEWVGALRRLYGHIAVSRTVPLPRGCTLLNLGTTWSEAHHLDDVAQARRDAGLRHVAYIHDLIPVLHPEWFVASLISDYMLWINQLPAVTDGYVAVSQSTRADLLAFAAARGAAIEPERVRVVREDGDFRRHAGGRATEPALSQLGLSAFGFVLMVSTVEPRKNHLGAFAAWLRLIGQLGEKEVPMLVCVGGKGWLNEEVHAMLAAHPALRRRVQLLSGIGDDVLTVLYHSCLFTLYPSFYEGWGLPVSESLCYGKVPAISRSSSLPEAGGPFAVYFDPADPDAIAAAVAPLVTDDRHREALEQAIATGYRARSWPAIAGQLLDEVRTLASMPMAPDAGR